MENKKHNQKVVRVFVKCLINNKLDIALSIINKYGLSHDKEDFEIIIQHYNLILDAEKVIQRVKKDVDVLIEKYFAK